MSISVETTLYLLLKKHRLVCVINRTDELLGLVTKRYVLGPSQVMALYDRIFSFAANIRHNKSL